MNKNNDNKTNKELINYEISMRLHLDDNENNMADLEITFPIEINEFKQKIESLGFSIDDVHPRGYCFNMLDEEGWNYNIIPKSLTLTDFNLIALIFDDINKLPYEKRLQYEKDVSKGSSFISSSSYQYLTLDDIKYYYKTINKKEFKNQELRKRLKKNYFNKHYVAGVIRRSIESGKDYFSDDVCWLA